MKRHPEGVWPVRFFADLGGLFFLADWPWGGDLLGVPLPFNLGVFLYFTTKRFDSGVLLNAVGPLLGVLGPQKRAGERPFVHVEVVVGIGLVATICQRSMGAGGTCFNLMSSFSWASLSIFLRKEPHTSKDHLEWTADTQVLKFPPDFQIFKS